MALPEHLQELARRVSNWGRWGDDDEIGTANLLTPEAARRGAASVRTGRTFSLALELNLDGPQVGQPPRRFNPLLTMLSVNERDPLAPGDWLGSDDHISMCTAAATHIDGLAHITYESTMYNGRPADAVTASGGATVCGVEKMPPIVTRGVLLDVARLKGVDILDGGYPITGDDLEQAAGRAGVTIESGDAVLVRTGCMRRFKDGDRKGYSMGESAGPSTQSIEWIRSHDVAAVFTDSYMFEVFPPEDWNAMLAVHIIHLRDMGLIQGQNWDLEELAADCEGDGQYDFLLSACGEPITGACSTPVNPVAVK